MANEAALKAACADLIIFSAAPEGDFPVALKAWIETWLSKRGDREGMLCRPNRPVSRSHRREGQKHQCLRNAAHHGAMDYLTQIPQDIAFSIPESIDSYTQRADQVTSLLDDILHQQLPPPANSWFDNGIAHKRNKGWGMSYHLRQGVQAAGVALLVLSTSACWSP